MDASPHKLVASQLVPLTQAKGHQRRILGVGLIDESLREAQHRGLGLAKAGNPRHMDLRHSQFGEMVECYASDFPRWQSLAEGLQITGLGSVRDKTVTLTPGPTTGCPTRRHRFLSTIAGRTLMALRHKAEKEGLDIVPVWTDVAALIRKERKEGEHTYEPALYRLHDSYRDTFDGPLAGELRKRTYDVTFFLESDIEERDEQVVHEAIDRVTKTSTQHNVKVSALAHLQGIFDPIASVLDKDLRLRMDTGAHYPGQDLPAIDFIKLLLPLLAHIDFHGVTKSRWGYYSAATVLKDFMKVMQHPDYATRVVDPKDATRFTIKVKPDTVLADILKELPEMVQLADDLQVALPDAINGTGKQMRSIRAKTTDGPNDFPKDKKLPHNCTTRKPYQSTFLRTPISHNHEWAAIFPVLSVMEHMCEVVDGRLSWLVEKPFDVVRKNFEDFVRLGSSGGAGSKSGYAYMITRNDLKDHIARDGETFLKCEMWIKDLLRDAGVKRRKVK